MQDAMDDAMQDALKLCDVAMRCKMRWRDTCCDAMRWSDAR